MQFLRSHWFRIHLLENIMLLEDVEEKLAGLLDFKGHPVNTLKEVSDEPGVTGTKGNWVLS